MKLRTKFQDEDFNPGEVVEANIYYGGSGRIKVITKPTKGGIITFYFKTLKGLNEMFEDYKEPEGMQWVDVLGANDGRVVIQYSNEGEAEKAVEKLKAWKRLKDASFEFGTIKYNLDEESSSTIAYEGIITIKGMAYEDFVEDLDLLFGGEE